MLANQRYVRVTKLTPCATFLKHLIYRAGFPRSIKLLTRNQGFQGFSCTSRKLADVQASGCLVVPIKGHTLVLFSRGDRLFEES